MDTGNNNVAVGRGALGANTTATFNTAVGDLALQVNSTGCQNVAVGRSSLRSLSTGINNTAIGDISACSQTTGSNNVTVGRNSGNDAMIVLTTESNRGVFGNTDITNAYVKVAWTVTSDCRDKMNISSVPHGLCFVNQIKSCFIQL
jgi:trimeric autotransporter adhesin